MSFIPTRQTTRKGTVRIGLSAQKVTFADEKSGAAFFARERLFEMREEDVERDGFVETGKLGGFA